MELWNPSIIYVNVHSNKLGNGVLRIGSFVYSNHNWTSHDWKSGNNMQTLIANNNDIYLYYEIASEGRSEGTIYVRTGSNIESIYSNIYEVHVRFYNDFWYNDGEFAASVSQNGNVIGNWGAYWNNIFGGQSREEAHLIPGNNFANNSVVSLYYMQDAYGSNNATTTMRMTFRPFG